LHVFTHCKPVCFVRFLCSRARKEGRKADDGAQMKSVTFAG